VWSTGVPPPGTPWQPLWPRDTAAVGSTAARAYVDVGFLYSGKEGRLLCK